MAINVGFPFKRTSAAPIDESLVLAKAQMLGMDDNSMPDKYFCVCTDDGKLYLYNKAATPNDDTGKYSVFEGGGAQAVELTQAQYNALSTEAKRNGTIYFITDADGGGGSGANEDAITELANRGWKNYIPYNSLQIGTSENLGVYFPEWIDPDRERLQVNGRTDTDTYIVILKPFRLNKGRYILSGLYNASWANAGQDTYYFELVGGSNKSVSIAKYPQDAAFEITDELDYYELELRFVAKAMPSGAYFDPDVDASIISPMIRSASIKDDTYIAPSYGLRELSLKAANAAKGANAEIIGFDNSMQIRNTATTGNQRIVSIDVNTSTKKMIITSAKGGTTPVKFEFTTESAYSLINPSYTDNKFGGGLRVQGKNGYATIMGTVINSAVAMAAKTEYKIASINASYRPTVEINAPISHNDIATASTIRIKTNGDVCIYPPVAIATGTPMFVCVTYPV